MRCDVVSGTDISEPSHNRWSKAIPVSARRPCAQYLDTGPPLPNSATVQNRAIRPTIAEWQNACLQEPGRLHHRLGGVWHLSPLRLISVGGPAPATPPTPKHTPPDAPPPPRSPQSPPRRRIDPAATRFSDLGLRPSRRQAGRAASISASQHSSFPAFLHVRQPVVRSPVVLWSPR